MKVRYSNAGSNVVRLEPHVGYPLHASDCTFAWLESSLSAVCMFPDIENKRQSIAGAKRLRGPGSQRVDLDTCEVTGVNPTVQGGFPVLQRLR